MFHVCIQLEKIDRDSIVYSEAVWNAIQENPEYYTNELSREDAIREIRSLTQDKFGKYVDTVKYCKIYNYL